MSDSKSTDEQEREIDRAAESDKDTEKKDRSKIELLNIADHEVEKKVYFRNSELCFRRGARVGIIGPSQSGKSEFILSCLQHSVDAFEAPFKKVFYISATAAKPSSENYINKLKEACEGIIIFRDLPSISALIGQEGEGEERRDELVIIDDLSLALYASDDYGKLFTVDRAAFFNKRPNADRVAFRILNFARQ